LGLTFGALTAFGIVFFIWRAPRLVSLEAIVVDALRHFDDKWMSVVREDWHRPVMQLNLRVGQDPLVIVERIIAKSIESGDNLSFTSGLVLLRERCQQVVRPDHMVEFDAYLHHHFRSVVRIAGKHADSRSLQQLIQFIRELGAPSDEAILKSKISGFDPPAGEMLVREIIREAITERLVEPVHLALAVVEEGSDAVLRTLPAGDETWMYNPKQRELRLLDDERFRANDLRIDAYEEQYPRYLGEIGESAIKSGLRETGWAVSHSISMIMLQIHQHAKGLRLKQILLRQCTFSLWQMSEAACEAKMVRSMTLSMLRFLAEELDKDSEEEIAWLLVNDVEGILLEQARIGVLDTMTVIDIAMLGLQIVRKFTKPAIKLIELMGKASEFVKSLTNFSENRELQHTYRELILRIRQQRDIATSDNIEDINTTVKSTLESLGEPEFEERRQS